MPEPLSTVACVVDTSVIVDFLRGRSYAAQLIREIAKEGEIGISAVSHAEIFAAVQPEVETVTGDVLDGFTSFDVTPALARRAGALLNQARSRGDQADIGDAVIAATAIELDVPLVTPDIDRYPFPGLNLVRAREALRRV